MDQRWAGGLRQETSGERTSTPESSAALVARQVGARLRGSAAIAAQLQRAILEGAHAYGDKLAPERDLARIFKVSRTTVRSALQRLENARLVVRQVGSGTYVSYRPSPKEGEIAEITSPLELIEVRLAIEPQMARLAVANATARDLDRLGETLARLEASGSDPEHFSRWDEEFHLRLVECTHNPLLAWIYREVNEVRGHTQWNARKDKILTPGRITEYNRQHRRLYDCLHSRDLEGSIRAITEHLEEARADLLGVDGD